MIVLKTVTPVFLIILLGYIIGKKTQLQLKPISFLAIYVMTPALFFKSLVNTSLNNQEFLQIFLFIILMTSATIIIVKLWSLAAKLPISKQPSIMLSTVFPNGGNYALPLVLFAFGQAGFERGVIFAVLQNLQQNTLGVYFASNSHLSPKKSLLNVLRMPGFWALILGLAIHYASLQLPELFMTTVSLVGQAAIPTMLLVLGIQLSQVKLGAELKLVSGATAIKLLIAPAIGFLILHTFFDPSALTSKVILLQASAPVAVTTTILAIQFDAHPEVVSNAALWSTVCSVLTVSAVLALLI